MAFLRAVGVAENAAEIVGCAVLVAEAVAVDDEKLELRGFGERVGYRQPHYASSDDADVGLHHRCLCPPTELKHTLKKLLVECYRIEKRLGLASFRRQQALTHESGAV